jgi:hypothetical protein
MADLTTMLELAAHVGRPGEPPRRAPALLRTAAELGDGVETVLSALDALRSGPPAERQLRRRRQAARLLMALAGESARAAAQTALGDEAAPGPLAALADAVAARTLDPWSAAETLR